MPGREVHVVEIDDPDFGESHLLEIFEADEPVQQSLDLVERWSVRIENKDDRIGEQAASRVALVLLRSNAVRFGENV
jgi:hypothetical protein